MTDNSNLFAPPPDRSVVNVESTSPSLDLAQNPDVRGANSANQMVANNLPLMPQLTPITNLPPDLDAAMELRGLVKIFGPTIAVAGLNLVIPQGAFYGFVGPNGSGKTTTLSMATGLLVPDQGTALVHGVDVWENPAAAKKYLGVLPDGMRTFDRLTGPELITYTGMLRGLDKKTARERAQDLIVALGLYEAGKTLVSDYSAGMTKKILLANALVHGPSVLVMDEPFESVDPISAQTIREILAEFRAGGGTIIFSSHVMETVQKLCTHVAVIDHGHIITSGTTAEVAAGTDLDTRFRQLIGGARHTEGLGWLKPSAD